MKNEEPPYELDEIILTLEAIKKNRSGPINPWACLLCLCKEIKKINEWIERRYDDD